MQRLKSALVCVLLASLAGLVICAGLAVWRVQAALCALPAAIHVELQDALPALVGEVGATRKDLVTQIVGVRSDVRGMAGTAIGTINATEKDANAQITGIRSDVADMGKLADARLASIQKDANAQLADIYDQVTTITMPLADVAHQIDDALPPFTQCAYYDTDGTPIGGNPDCLFNRFQGMSKSTEKAARDVSALTGDLKADMPVLLANANKITEASAKASDSTAQVMANFATATKPLPAWLRTALIVSPAASSVATALVAAGVIH